MKKIISAVLSIIGLIWMTFFTIGLVEEFRRSGVFDHKNSDQ